MIDGPNADWYESIIDNPNHKLKRLPNNTPIISDMIFAQDYVLFNHYEKDKESAIKITQPDLKNSLEAVFDLLWEKI